jgi:hypothetical protein
MIDKTKLAEHRLSMNMMRRDSRPKIPLAVLITLGIRDMPPTRMASYLTGLCTGISESHLAGLDSSLNKRVDKAFELGPHDLHVDMLGTGSIGGGEWQVDLRLTIF